MVDPAQVIVEWLSNPARTFVRDGQTITVGSLHTYIAANSPVPGFNILDHIQGGTSLPSGYKADEDGPLVLIDTMPGGARPQHGKIWPVRAQVQVYASTDEGAYEASAAVLEVLDGAYGPKITHSTADGVPQVIRDDETEWLVGLTFYTVQIRNS